MGRLPSQIITWMHYNVGDERDDWDEPQFLYALPPRHRRR